MQIKNSNLSHTIFLDQGEFLGGAERFLVDFFQNLNSLEKKQISPLILGGKSQKYQKFMAGVPIEDFTFPSVKGNIFYKFFAIFHLLWTAWKLKKVIHSKKTRTIFSNTPRTHFVMLLAKSIFGIKGRWVCMFHDFTVPKFLVKAIGNTADVLIANSMPTRNFLRNCIANKNYDKIQIVENGIDFTQIPNPICPKEIKNILILGRIDPRKGQFFALEAADILQKTHPNLNFTFVGNPVASDPATLKYQKKCQDFVRFRKLKNVQFVPEVENPFETILKFDLALFLPTERETFGRVVIEALALGKLVLSFDMTGPRETLKNYEHFLRYPKTSVLIEGQNAKALAEKIAFFVDHPSEIKLFTEKARPFVEKNFSLEETRKRLVGILVE